MSRCRSSAQISSNSLSKVLHFVPAKLGAFIPPTGCSVIKVLVGGFISAIELPKIHFCTSSAGVVGAIYEILTSHLLKVKSSYANLTECPPINDWRHEGR
jgi:hypothetical protein